jgi:peptidoglycan/LPS O-acetylase OafA/YrhL
MTRLSRLDGLRGVLSVYVMLGHAMPFTMLPAWIQGPVHHGEAAVDVFFALSGLVIVQSLAKFPGHPWGFLRARARRLLPVYFSVLALALGLILLGSPLPAMPWVRPGSAAAEFWALALPGHFAWHLAAHLALVQGLIPQGALPWAYITLLGPAWSLSTEWQFYALVAVCMPRRLGVFAGLLLGAGAVFHGLAPHLPAYWQFSRAFLPDAAPYFALGVASAIWLRDGRPLPFWLVLAGACLLEFYSGEPAKALIPLGWAVALAAQLNPAMPVLPRLLDAKAAQYLGAISYPLYLLNEPVQRACAMVLAPLAGGDAALFSAIWLPAALIIPVLAAACLHRFVETPCLAPRPVVTSSL